MYEISKMYPNPHLNDILKDLIYSFISENEKNKFDFNEYYPEAKTIIADTSISVIDSIITFEKDDATLSKYEKLQKIRLEQATSSDEEKDVGVSKMDYTHFAFTKYNDRSKIEKLFEITRIKVLSEVHVEKLKEKEYENMTDRQRSVYDKKTQDNDAAMYDSRNEIGAEKVVFVDPVYLNIDERKGVKLVNSEDLKYKFYDQIELVGDRAGLETEILSARENIKPDFNKMNHLSICNDWVEEINALKTIHESLNFIPSQSEYMNTVSNVYNTNNICFTGVIDVKVNKDFINYYGFSIIPYTWPFIVYNTVSPPHEVYYYTFIYDSDSGMMKVDNVYFAKKKAMGGLIQSHMYDVFKTIKRESK